MSFAGNLEDLAIIDVIQLLHSTRKTGTLSVKGRKGESRLVFKDGYIVGANHSNKDVNIGEILIEIQVISAATRDHAIEIQKNAGQSRKPLIATLVESEQINRQEAFKGLETLIEMTVVDMVSWTKGTFTLDVDEVQISDEFRYFPEKFEQEISLDTQMVLLDALRIYDEKKRDGEIEEEEDFEADPAETDDDPISISADDLGLGDLETKETKIKESFSSFVTFDPSDIHRQIVLEAIPDVSPEQRDELVACLAGYSRQLADSEASSALDEQTRGIILLSKDKLLSHAVMTICKFDGRVVFTASRPEDFIAVVEQCLGRDIDPALIIDAPDEFSSEDLSAVHQELLDSHPALPILQLAGKNQHSFTMEALQSGVRVVLPMPEKDSPAFASELIELLQTIPAYLQNSIGTFGHTSSGQLKFALSALRRMSNGPDIAQLLMQFTSKTFNRTLTLIHKDGELFAEKSIGIMSAPEEGIAESLKFKIRIEENSIFEKVVQDGKPYLGEPDEALSEALFSRFAPPSDTTICLLPMQARGKTVTLTYADFGQSNATSADLDQLTFLASHAGLTLENRLLRKQLGE